VKIKYIDKALVERNEVAKIYSENLSNLNLEIPQVLPNSEHSFHLYVIRIKNREKVIEKLNQMKIFPGIHYKVPVHLNPAFAKYSHEKLSVTENVANEILSLPMYPGIKRKEVFKVIKEINDAIKF
jgi:dTDP-4-amino-4,6-dideoxygalactose transaminase